jgi:hypothetical protein
MPRYHIPGSQPGHARRSAVKVVSMAQAMAGVDGALFHHPIMWFQAWWTGFHHPCDAVQQTTRVL